MIVEAHSDLHLACVRKLFLEYAESLGFDLSFQDFERELEELPGEYGEPSGCVLVAIKDQEAAGCAALRDLGNSVAEMKRLYVGQPFRGSGLGRLLALRIIEEARKRGYACMRLDTVPLDDAGHRALSLARLQAHRAVSIQSDRRCPFFPELEVGSSFAR
jgi:GNAT superfamily N-acetyltransferase